jgi:hypothetical protein
MDFLNATRAADCSIDEDFVPRMFPSDGCLAVGVGFGVCVVNVFSQGVQPHTLRKPLRQSSHLGDL